MHASGVDDTPAVPVETRHLGRVFQRTRPGRWWRRWRGGPDGVPGPPVVALDDVTLRVEAGEIFGLLGPNGAGKTTLIKVLSTLLLPSSGEARVLGYDVVSRPVPVRERIGVVSGGEVSGYGILTVRENLWFFSQMYGIPGPEARRRADALLQAFGLWAYRDTKMNRLSTGYRQRLNVARGFISDPELVFLDEPTLGLDVEIARQIRAFVRSWVAERPGRRTVLLTTHYMAEADELCDRVAIIDRGRIVACDTPGRMKQLLKDSVVLRIRMVAAGEAHALREAALQAGGVRAASARTRPADDSVELTLMVGEDAQVPGVLAALEGRGGRIVEFHKPEPTLEEVFLKLVGRGLEDNGARSGDGAV